jgi:putative serine protease PepD
MPPSPLSPPALWSDMDTGTPDERPADPGDAAPPPRRSPAPPGGPSRGRAPLAVLLVASALLGGAASAGVLAATGVLDNDAVRTTTVIQRPDGSTTESTSDGGLDAEALYAGASAGVVDITAKGTTSAGENAPVAPFGGTPQQQESTATGTGFVIDEEGHIITASHVVDGASSITIRLEDGTTRKATVLGQDDATDVAVLKIDPAGLELHPLPLGSSASLDVGDEIAAIGDPFGYERSISTGIVSGVDRTIEAPNGFTVAHAIQTDAAMNPGNSGGPLLNAAGEVVGIADQIATGGGAEQSAGVGFAVPIDLVKAALEKLKAGEQVLHAYLGVATTDSATGVSGATVAQVTSGGPAEEAGLRAGDVVTRLGDAKVGDSNDLVAAIAAHSPGDELAVTVRRGSETQQLEVTLGTQPQQSG